MFIFINALNSLSIEHYSLFIPTGIFKDVFPCMASDLLHIVNTSLHSGVFPQALKTAVIKPLLKKNNLDASVMNQANIKPAISM